MVKGDVVYVRWYGQVVEGRVVSEHDLMGMVAVRIPVQGMEATALFTPGHVYDTAEEAENPKSVPKIAKSVPKIEEIAPKDSEIAPKDSETVPIVSETSMCDAFKKAHWDNEHNHLRTDSLDEFYWLWRMEHTPFGYTDAEPVPKHEIAPEPKQQKKKSVSTIQLSLFE